MTFDNVPWVITMKKNDHYFPTTEWIKVQPSSTTKKEKAKAKTPDGDDASSEEGTDKECSGWRRITYEHGKVVKGEGHEGLMPAGGGEDVFYGDDGGAGDPYCKSEKPK